MPCRHVGGREPYVPARMDSGKSAQREGTRRMGQVCED